MKKLEEIELVIEKFADRGKSLARVDGIVFFVAGGVPGDRVRAQVLKKKRKHAEGRILELLEPSPLRTSPRCAYFGTCGGCKWQHVDYQAQLDAKQQSVEDALRHTGGFSDVPVRPTIGADPIYYYRNKMEFSFSAARWLTTDEIASGDPIDTHFALGLHAPGHFSKVIDISACYLQSETSVRIVNALRDLAKANDWAPWDIRKHHGYLRHLVIRSGQRTGELMVNLYTNGYEPDRMELLQRHLKAHIPEVTTLVNSIHTGPAQAALAEATHVMFGPGVIHDVIGGFRFEIAPNAFFQTNTPQAERLYEVARAFADLRPDDLVYDLFCGAGTISIYVAAHARHVIGIEVVPEAVANARANAAANQVENCTFVLANLRKLQLDHFVSRMP
ncbi:MAG: 23S rRNA (uracil(1939)-C(5))-methyltransferase RlmD [Rhodothermales bacterium]